MKKYFIVFALLMPLFIYSQDFSESFDKTQTLSWISKNIKPTGNTSSMRSLKTQVTYTENFFDKNGAAIYSFDLAKVSFSIVGKKVRINCSSGSCISYTYKSAGNRDVKNLSSFDLEAKNSVSQLNQALNHLKRRVGL